VVDLEAFTLGALSLDEPPEPVAEVALPIDEEPAPEPEPPVVDLEAFTLGTLAPDEAPAPLPAPEAADRPEWTPEPPPAMPRTETETGPPAPAAIPEAAGPSQGEPTAGDFTLSGEGSLDFLGGSTAPGVLAMEEDDAPSGQAAEQLAEADVYLKYGLEDKARERLVEVVRLSPNSVTVRRKLKTLYRDQREVEAACDQIAAIAKILEERQRHDAARQEVLEGLELMPGHTELRRLLDEPPPAPAPAAPAPSARAATGPQGRLAAPPVAPPSETAAGQPEAVLETAVPGVADETPPPAVGPRLPVEHDLPPEVRALLNEPEDAGPATEAVPDGADRLADDLAEADFYLSQGMVEEARGVVRQLERAFPDNAAVAAIVARLASTPRNAGSFSAVMFQETPTADTVPDAPEAAASQTPGRAPASPASVFTVREDQGGGGSFVDLRAELEMELEPETSDAPRSEAALVNGLLSELQRGVREQVDAKDFETHYNLGIAYKEMDLYDEAIQEFRLAAGDPKRVLECADLLGQCHLAKGQPQLAVAELTAGLEVPGHPPEAYRSLRYGLALAHEALGEDAAALEQLERLHTEDPRFRDVQGRLQALQERSPGGARVEPAPSAQPAAAATPAAPKPPSHGKRRKISFI
jgi:tetratricopeptide (TPR) repeat protein